MKTGYTVRWVKESEADKTLLKAQHQRTFPGNELAIVRGYVKVSVMDAETLPLKSISMDSVKAEWAKLPPEDSPMGAK